MLHVRTGLIFVRDLIHFYYLVVVSSETPQVSLEQCAHETESCCSNENTKCYVNANIFVFFHDPYFHLDCPKLHQS